MKKEKPVDQYAFIHKKTYLSELEKHKLTKVEMALLVKYDFWKQIRNRANSLEEVTPFDFSRMHQPQNALQLQAQCKKESCDKYTEVHKNIVWYSRGVYLVRMYKLVNESFMKLEVTKVPLGTKKYMNAEGTITGLLKLLKYLVGGYEESLLPHYMHNGVYQSIPEFYKECAPVQRNLFFSL